MFLMRGVSSVDISLKDQLVKVDATSASYEDVENAIRKTGKVIKSGKVIGGAKDAETEGAQFPHGVEGNQVVA
jgi:copper chaperone CopZ